jgi:hypothetical protein
MGDPLAALSALLLRRRLAVSALVFLAMGFGMNALGHLLSIAWFKHWWQVVPCYLGYVLPLALVVRGSSTWAAWRTSVLAFIPLELIGYALGSSVVADGNIIATLLGPHNFTLAMVLVVSPTPLIGNAVVDRLLPVVDRIVDGWSPPAAMP